MTAPSYMNATGPTCDGCRTTEQRCAYIAGCCPDCTHFDRLDEHGNELPTTGGRPRKPREHDTERGYQQHRQDGTPPCIGCRRAHRAYNDALEAHVDRHACAACGRRTPHRRNRQRIRHRIEADNPIAPWCPGDDG